MSLCDCERSHNGLGLAGRECDCPAGYNSLSISRLNELLDYATNYRTVSSRTAAIPEQAEAIHRLELAIRRAKRRRVT